MTDLEVLFKEPLSLSAANLMAAVGGMFKDDKTVIFKDILSADLDNAGSLIVYHGIARGDQSSFAIPWQIIELANRKFYTAPL